MSAPRKTRRNVKKVVFQAKFSISKAGLIAEEMARCERFNETWPVGSLVAVRSDDNTCVLTTTAGPAHMPENKLASIELKGIGGLTWLSRVYPVRRQVGAE